MVDTGSGPLINLQAQIALLNEQAERCVRQVTDIISSFPDNDKITKKAGHFIISSYNLNDVWSPDYHDFKFQYNAVVAELKKGNPLKVIDNLEKIVNTKKVLYQEPGRPHIPYGWNVDKISRPAGRTVKLHETVIKNLKALLPNER
jgi:hypothetical protein